jgi:hypothetical protein
MVALCTSDHTSDHTADKTVGKTAYQAVYQTVDQYRSWGQGKSGDIIDPAQQFL